MGILFWVGTCVYANFFGNNEKEIEIPDMPEREQAGYVVNFKATGNILLTNNYETLGEDKYILYGYWENRGNDFYYIDKNLVLDERIFGDIIIERRAE